MLSLWGSVNVCMLHGACIEGVHAGLPDPQAPPSCLAGGSQRSRAPGSALLRRVRPGGARLHSVLLGLQPPLPLCHRGKFGEVRTCTEKQTGLKLAAKIIRKQGPKDKVGAGRACAPRPPACTPVHVCARTDRRDREGGSADPAVPVLQEMALVEIDVMNQLNHQNLIQLYDAIETPREIMLFMEL